MAGEVRGCAFPKAYSVIAHGCDIVSEDRHVIPEGCAYVTVELCGHLSYVYEKIMFAMLDLTVRPQLKDPCANIDILKTYFNEGDLKIRNAGESYTDAEYSGFLDMVGHRGRIYKSGLYEIESFRPVLGIYPGGVEQFTEKFYLEKAAESIITRDDYDKIYFGSMPETRTPFIEGRTIAYYTHTNYRWRLSSAFLIYPGVYYNFVCRIPCDPVGQRGEILDRVARVRRASNPAVQEMNPLTIVNRPTFNLATSFRARLHQARNLLPQDVDLWILKQVMRVLPLFYDDSDPQNIRVRIHDGLKGTAFHAYINALLQSRFPGRLPPLELTQAEIAALAPMGEPVMENTSPLINNSRYPVEDRVGLFTSYVSANVSIRAIKEAIKRLIYYLHHHIFPDFLLRKTITEVNASKRAQAMYELIVEGLWSPEVKRQVEAGRTEPDQTYESMRDQRPGLNEALNGLLQNTLVVWVDECIRSGLVGALAPRNDVPRLPPAGAPANAVPQPPPQGVGVAQAPAYVWPQPGPLAQGVGVAQPPQQQSLRPRSAIPEFDPRNIGLGGAIFQRTRKSKRRLRKHGKNKTRHLK